MQKQAAQWLPVFFCPPVVRIRSLSRTGRRVRSYRDERLLSIRHISAQLEKQLDALAT